MKLGLLGDIHGNALALESVLKSAAKLGVQKLLVTGDLVGYYFQPRKVMELLASWNSVTVRGNHENMLASAIESPELLAEIEKKYGAGLSTALEQLNKDQVMKLTQLPETQKLNIDSCHILLCHGSPWDTDQYIYPDASEQLLKECTSFGMDIIIMGHTHYPMYQKIGTTLLINPGSVGQPRNKRPGASWALLDTKTKNVTFRNESYPIQLVAEEASRREPMLPYLAEVLVRT
jgi:putative phosphoesterase